MHVALTGTPGVGKRTVGSLLAGRGHAVLHLEEVAQERGLLGPQDRRTGAREVDVEALEHTLPASDGDLVLCGHFAHRLPCDVVVVLRCYPELLRRRLRARNWPAAKVQENVEAEAVGVIAYEALEAGGEVFEVDTSEASVEETADAVEAILRGEGTRYRAPWVDWSEVILGWY